MATTPSPAANYPERIAAAVDSEEAWAIYAVARKDEAISREEFRAANLAFGAFLDAHRAPITPLVVFG
jgi:hypothetical protein